MRRRMTIGVAILVAVLGRGAEAQVPQPIVRPLIAADIGALLRSVTVSVSWRHSEGAGRATACGVRRANP